MSLNNTRAVSITYPGLSANIGRKPSKIKAFVRCLSEIPFLAYKLRLCRNFQCVLIQSDKQFSIRLTKSSFP